ncbi:MAG: helix-turn-helix domain-containing protein [Clostridia bacterium]|nr:helix-turn-helix domain-containing protein [Clostridia bacterium]
MNDFSEFLYTLRKEKGMTQAQLAELLGVTNKAVSKWETGEAMPETSLLLPLSRILGVTVDELLDGKRNIENTANYEDIKRETTSEEYDPKAQFDFDDIKRHMFTKAKEDEKTVLESICGVVCASVFFLGLMSYLLIGAVWNLWSPYWIIIPICTLSCGIIGIIFDLFDVKKRNRKKERGENPYIGAICGVIMLVCTLTYLILGVIFSLWHPYWIIIVIGSFLCAIIGSIGGIISHKNHKN